MNWLLIVMLLFIAGLVLLGRFKGFAKMGLKFLSLALSLGITLFLVQPVTGYIREHTGLTGKISDRIYDIVIQSVEAETAAAEETGEADSEDEEGLDALGLGIALPAILSEKLEAGQEIVQAAAEERVRQLSDSLADKFLTAGVYLALFLLLWLILSMVSYLIIRVIKHTPLKKIDRFFGMLFGLLEALLIIGVFFLFVTVISSTEIGGSITESIAESKILTWVYNNNPVLLLLTLVRGA